jgi:hypothetical protein
MQSTSLQKASSGLLGALAIAGGSAAYGDVVVVAPPADLAPSQLPEATGIDRFWDVDGDAIDDIQFNFRQPQTSGSLDWQGNFFGQTASTFAQLGPPFFYVHRFNAGDTIGPLPPTGEVVLPPAQQGIFASNFNGIYYGQFQPPNSRGFLGFQFTNSMGTFFGYLELQITRASAVNDPGFQFFAAAYDDTPGTPIIAGAIPEPGTLSMLVLGAAGLLAACKRRSRKQAG